MVCMDVYYPQIVIILCVYRRLRYEEESAGDKKGTAVRQCMEKGPGVLATFILK